MKYLLFQLFAICVLMSLSSLVVHLFSGGFGGFGNTSTGSIFGTPSTKASGGLFGTPAQGFGTSTQSGFGSAGFQNTSGGLFGSNTPASTSSFGGGGLFGGACMSDKL